MPRGSKGALTVGERKILRLASRDVTVDNLGVLRRRYFRHRRWIPATNRYATNTLKRLWRDAGANAIQMRDISHYVAASAPAHCLDGWSYLGRSVDAISRGDSYAAIHLAYYASLRAAMSLLASEGFGVFNSPNVVAESDPWGGPPQTVGGRTHQVTWHGLSAWSSLTRSGKRIGGVIRPLGVRLSEWYGGTPGRPWEAPASQWLRLWGADLRLLSNDQERRNDASYRPRQVAGRALNPTPNVVLGHVADLWDIVEPVPRSPFDRLDRHLLRLAIEKSFSGSTGSAPTGPAFESYVDRVIRTPPIKPPAAFRDFLLRRVAGADHPVLVRARQPATDPRERALQVQSRSILLLRVATGAVADCLVEAGITQSSTEFWWLETLRDHGVWDGAAPPPDLEDLWLDVESAVDEARAMAAGAVGSHYNWTSTHASAHVALGGFERAGIWGIYL